VRQPPVAGGTGHVQPDHDEGDGAAQLDYPAAEFGTALSSQAGMHVSGAGTARAD